MSGSEHVSALVGSEAEAHCLFEVAAQHVVLHPLRTPLLAPIAHVGPQAALRLAEGRSRARPPGQGAHRRRLTTSTPRSLRSSGRTSWARPKDRPTCARVGAERASRRCVALAPRSARSGPPRLGPRRKQPHEVSLHRLVHVAVGRVRAALTHLARATSSAASCSASSNSPCSTSALTSASETADRTPALTVSAAAETSGSFASEAATPSLEKIWAESMHLTAQDGSRDLISPAPVRPMCALLIPPPPPDESVVVAGAARGVASVAVKTGCPERFCIGRFRPCAATWAFRLPLQVPELRREEWQGSQRTRQFGHTVETGATLCVLRLALTCLRAIAPLPQEHCSNPAGPERKPLSRPSANASARRRPPPRPLAVPALAAVLLRRCRPWRALMLLAAAHTALSVLRRPE